MQHWCSYVGGGFYVMSFLIFPYFIRDDTAIFPIFYIQQMWNTHTVSVNVQITNTSLRNLWSRRLVLLQFQPLEPLGQKVWDQESWSFVDRIQEFKMIQGIPMKCYKITRFLAILTINIHHPYAIHSMNFCFFLNHLWKILPNDTLHTASSSHCMWFFFWHIHYPHFF